MLRARAFVYYFVTSKRAEIKEKRVKQSDEIINICSPFTAQNGAIKANKQMNVKRSSTRASPSARV
jgi:hypothetical protein